MFRGLGESMSGTKVATIASPSQLFPISLGACTALAALSTVQSIAQLETYDARLAPVALFAGHATSWCACGIFMPLTVALTKRFPVSPARWQIPLLAHLAASSVLAVLAVAIFYALGTPIERGPFAYTYVVSQDFFSALWMFLAASVASHAYRFHVDGRDREHSLASLRTELAEINNHVDRWRVSSNPDVGRPRPREHFVAREPNGVRLIQPEDIVWIEAQGNYARFHTGSGRALVRATMTRLDSMLDAGRFIRIHRGTIVSKAHIRAVRSLTHGEYEVTLTDGTQLSSSRSYAASIAQLIR